MTIKKVKINKHAILSLWRLANLIKNLKTELAIQNMVQVLYESYMDFIKSVYNVAYGHDVSELNPKDVYCNVKLVKYLEDIFIFIPQKDRILIDINNKYRLSPFTFGVVVHEESEG